MQLARTQSYNKQLLKEIGRLLVAAEHEQRSLKEDRSSHLETHTAISGAIARIPCVIQEAAKRRMSYFVGAS